MKTFHLTENAVKNHEALFPKDESKLQKTDPEFVYPRTLNALRVIDEVVPPTNITSAASTAH